MEATDLCRKKELMDYGLKMQQYGRLIKKMEAALVFPSKPLDQRKKTRTASRGSEQSILQIFDIRAAQ